MKHKAHNIPEGDPNHIQMYLNYLTHTFWR